MVKKKINKINMAFIIISSMFYSWIIASYIDVLVHQYAGGTKAMWNFFVVMLKFC